MCANVSSTSQSTTVYYYDVISSTSYAIVYQVVIPAYSTLDVLVRPFYLKENDKIQALAGNNSSIHLIVSYETIQ